MFFRIGVRVLGLCRERAGSSLNTIWDDTTYVLLKCLACGSVSLAVDR